MHTVVLFLDINFMYNVAVHMSANLGAIIVDNSSLITSATVQTLNLYMVFLYACSIIGTDLDFLLPNILHAEPRIVSCHIVSCRIVSHCINVSCKYSVSY